MYENVISSNSKGASRSSHMASDISNNATGPRYNALPSRVLARDTSCSFLRAPSTLVNKASEVLNTSLALSSHERDSPRGRRHRRTPACDRENWYRVTSRGAVRPRTDEATSVVDEEYDPDSKVLMMHELKHSRKLV